jgi:uncharacterized protein with HEPN domain
MSKDDLAYVGHILDTGQKVLEKIRGRSRAEFDADENLRLALTHLLQIIGEAAGRISADFRQRHSEIPWKAIIGMRHKVVHDYMNVDENVVWRTATEELPDLVTRLESLTRKKAGGDGP